jgi:TPP-dependent pyruvate/acetoin dehydrogenase alpha subunit
MAKMSKDVRKRLFERLLKTRRLEETLVEVFQTGDVPGWLHAAFGHEAVGVGVASCLEKTDLINNTHRGRGTVVAKGIPLKRFLSECMGKQGGPGNGMCGEGHYCDTEYGILGNSGLLGATISVAVGAALAAKNLKTGQVVISLCGDGTVDEGAFHENMNIASLWKLPIVFVIDNNGWAQFSPQKDTAAQLDIWKKAEGYNMPGIVADGSDVFEVYQKAQEAIARARRGEGPTLIEYKVTRWLGHYVGDPQKYRDPEDIKRAREVDPVRICQEALLKERIIDNNYIQELENKIKDEIQEAVAYAKSLPLASVEQAFKNVYVEDGEL